ncbi:hypothetical protein KKC45_03775 [Patescibacteria group bacterium]|nr:hypothetical protein [Patescibacteria group bacterium]
MKNFEEEILNLNKKDMTKTELFLGILSILVISVLVGWFWVSQQKNDPILEEKAGTLVEEKKNYFDDVSLEAKSAYVLDAKENNVLFNLNGQSQLPLASVTKLMTTLVASEMVPEGTIITINQEDISVEGDSGLRVGEKWTLSNVLDFTLMSSSNDGAHALASVIGFVKLKEDGKTEDDMFIDEMNRRAQELGLTQTFFLSESGLDLSEGMSGSYGSARDMAILMKNIIETNPQLLKATKYSNLEIESKDFVHSVENTNQYAEAIPGIIGSKTGFTDLAGGNLVIAFDIGIGHPIIISVLGSSKDGRFEDVQKLVEASIKKFSNN